MPFLSGSLGFERFSVSGFDTQTFSDEHIEKLQQAASGKFVTTNTENVQVGFLGGEHLFDQHFDLGKNLINDALHVAVRIDTNQVPSAIRKAWMTMELSALAKDNSSGRPTKAQRQEAKEAVEARCEAEAATGKYRKMSQFPILWDFRQNLLYFGGSGASAISHCSDLFERTFDVELSRITAGSIANEWAHQTGLVAELDDLFPSAFALNQRDTDLAWANPDSRFPDFLGNEFLMWLWWMLETETDTFTLDDDTEVTAMLTKTLSLECPLGEHGKETISAEVPTKLAEAIQAIRSGKLPRKSGMTLVRQGQQFDLVLQAETFAISGAKIHCDDADDAHDIDLRIDAIRMLGETVDKLFHAFCTRRVSNDWSHDKASHFQVAVA
ncbi:MAG: hypothetical protein R3C53_10535 [Pirellulaceae bacterium]